MLEWWIEFPVVPKLTIKLIRLWNGFTEWLRLKELYTVFDLRGKIESRLKVSSCKQYYKYKEESQKVKFYQRNKL